MSDLVYRLRMHRTWRTGDGDISDAPHLAADRISALESENAQLRVALARISVPMPGCAWAATERQEIAGAALAETGGGDASI